MLRTLLLLTACVALLAPNAHSQGAVDFRDALRMTFPATVSIEADEQGQRRQRQACLLYTSPSPRDKRQSRMPSSA